MYTARAFVAAVFAVFFAAVSADDVLKLTKDNFDDVIAKEPLVFIKFFAPWCGHCKSMAEDFKNVATEMKGKAVLADVDATTEEELAKKYNIEGFPTLKLFSDGVELTDYNGARDKDSMIKFIERATLPPFHSPADADAYKKIVTDNSEKHLLVSAGLEGQALSMFKKATFGVRDVMPDAFEFIVADDASAVDIESFSKGDVYMLRLESDGSRRTIKYDEAAAESIEKFVKTAALPVFQEFTQENAELYTDLSMPLVVGFYKNCEDKQCKVLETVARKKPDNGKAVFAWVDSMELVSFQDYVGLKDAEVPICAYSFEHDARYLLPADFNFSEETLEAWVDDLIAGKIKPAIKSEAVPEENDGPVYVVVGDSWSDIVEDKTKDVMVAQVAEWCGHCAKLKPVYKKVATELQKAGIEHVKLAMMEATENDAPDEFKARGFPTIHFFKAGEEQTGIEFDGDRSSKGIIEWIKEHTSKKFEFDTSSLGEDPEPEEEEEEFPEEEGEFDEEGELGEGEGDADLEKEEL
ncbi:Protein disulfide-isomerase [Gracilariopsis chorda]|uniref:protein disulfide-isomerase n=1 Tax=Gracilariopsis chorda TaxID=448386 RepID=A0A2V3IFT3_9FLOR|nr:Protein disulfide-isomerase [Gracilariopsis chorda]|eukprot:PXF40945.1 Protein disulfide-isomerase [Gracilariopsis chorda]